jgi:hypothetical protein
MGSSHRFTCRSCNLNESGGNFLGSHGIGRMAWWGAVSVRQVEYEGYGGNPPLGGWRTANGSA